MNKEDQEFNEFMAKLAHKVHEIQDDYNKLSYNNKIRTSEFAEKMIQAKDIADIVNFLNRFIK